MAGPFPAIHVLASQTESKTWMPGTSPGMTAYYSATTSPGAASIRNAAANSARV